MTMDSATKRPLLLDLFCGAGGAAVGYHRAGFDVLGVDIAPQKRYPFSFIQADALEMLAWLIASGDIQQFAAIHASPPCQADSLISRNLGYASNHIRMIVPTRALLEDSGVPWIMENVEGAPLRNPLMLCGSSFGLGIAENGWYLRRHRLFESSELLFAASPCRHRGRAISVCGLGTPKPIRDAIGRTVKLPEYRRLMGIDWMTRGELSQAIPPAYTEWIGRQLLAALANTTTAA